MNSQLTSLEEYYCTFGYQKHANCNDNDGGKPIFGGRGCYSWSHFLFLIAMQAVSTF